MADIAATASRVRPRRPLSVFETWPCWLFYAPIPFLWLYLALRHRGLTLPVLANTAAPWSGFLGESKSEGLALLGPTGRLHFAPGASFRSNASGDRHDNGLRARAAMHEAGLEFPVVAKPDVGQNGAGVKIIRDGNALDGWLSAFPRDTKAILQKYIGDEGEAGVFYVRRPRETHGRVVSLTLKYLPHVKGDGVSTLRELILRDRRARHVAPLYFVRHRGRLDRVVPSGERVRLVSVGNHCRGAIFKNGARHITPRMEAAFDTIAREIPGFCFGRFDVKFPTLRDLEQGKSFTILEINGGDAEMTHIWDADETLGRAYTTLFRQYRIAFEIGAENRARGYRPVAVRAFLAAWLRNRARLKAYSPEE
ncbi:MAG TPA: hypothetical protein VMD53_16875 [Rhizomicrobium sp.]|nr:hypothetical protein [Rhizomicrobium sp.]